MLALAPQASALVAPRAPLARSPTAVFSTPPALSYAADKAKDAPEEEITASNNMQLDIRNSPHTICLSGVNDIWQVDTEDSDVNDDEEAMKDAALTQCD